MGFAKWFWVEVDTRLGQGLGWTCFGNGVWDGVCDVGGGPSRHKAAIGLQNKIGDRGGPLSEPGEEQGLG